MKGGRVGEEMGEEDKVQLAGGDHNNLVKGQGVTTTRLYSLDGKNDYYFGPF